MPPVVPAPHFKQAITNDAREWLATSLQRLPSPLPPPSQLGSAQVRCGSRATQARRVLDGGKTKAFERPCIPQYRRCRVSTSYNTCTASVRYVHTFDKCHGPVRVRYELGLDPGGPRPRSWRCTRAPLAVHTPHCRIKAHHRPCGDAPSARATS